MTSTPAVAFNFDEPLELSVWNRDTDVRALMVEVEGPVVAEVGATFTCRVVAVKREVVDR